MQTQTQTNTNARRALIIGGGIAGPAAALFLQRIGIASVIYEAEDAPDYTAGAFVTVAANGLDVLRTLGLFDKVVAYGSPNVAIRMWNRHGKVLATFRDANASDDPNSIPNLTIKRGLLNMVLREEAVRSGIPVKFGKKLIGITETPSQGVVASFADGSQASGDLLIGCDGIHSRTRQALFRDSPKPRYTGSIGCGGFARNAAIPSSADIFNLVRGKEAFFGYQVMDSGEIFWFDHMQWPDEPKRGELNAVPQSEWKRRLQALHRDDPAPVPQIMASLTNEVGTYAIYDLPGLTTWHKGRACLIGDAAHATSPHAGQGASLALEDAVVLAQSLRDIPEVQQAFAAFQDMRLARVQKVMQLARRNGQNHFSSNPVSEWIQGAMMPVFSKLFPHGDDWLYSYKVDWNAKTAMP